MGSRVAPADWGNSVETLRVSLDAGFAERDARRAEVLVGPAE